MTWADPTGDVRALISDGPEDKLRHRKPVIEGLQDGINKTFKTLEFRRVTDFTTAVAPFGVFLDGVAQVVGSDVPKVGEFVLSVAPANSGERLTSTYYIEWFLDTELDIFIRNAAQWVSSTTIINDVPTPLVPAAIQYAASEAYQKLAVRWQDSLTSTYRTEDDGADPKTLAEQYIQMSKQYLDRATTLRDDFHTRQGRSKAPRSANLLGTVRPSEPRR